MESAPGRRGRTPPPLRARGPGRRFAGGGRTPHRLHDLRFSSEPRWRRLPERLAGVRPTPADQGLAELVEARRPDLEVQVRPRRIAGATDLGDLLPGFDQVPWRDQDAPPPQVVVAGGEDAL